MNIEHILNAALNEAMCQKGRIQNPDSNKIAEFVTEYLKTEKLPIQGVRHLLPDANKLYSMAKVIVEKEKKAIEIVDKETIDWEGLTDDWFDWLEEELKGNCA